MPFPDEIAPVTVVGHRPDWSREFGRLAKVVGDALGEVALAIDHVGSTSVPGLAAKDCVDIQVRVAALDEERLVSLFAAIGFRCRPEPWNRAETSAGTRCRKLVFAPPPGARRCNVHIREHGGPNARFALLFRDYLRADATARDAWGAFKLRLAESVPDWADYGQIKAPATEVLMAAAERWAADTGWRIPGPR
ncbi:GrpB family protein [Amycolatopsis sp. NPDC059021]|uniref:GrpB family protein n=1 Tax=Amycolatopsis sp. NPDC059021 TaxID=3346704 RepID=UPI0036719BA3